VDPAERIAQLEAENAALRRELEELREELDEYAESAALEARELAVLDDPAD
jgi:regulator of replication initiation timing